MPQNTFGRSQRDTPQLAAGRVHFCFPLSPLCFSDSSPSSLPKNPVNCSPNSVNPVKNSLASCNDGWPLAFKPLIINQPGLTGEDSGTQAVTGDFHIIDA